MTFTAVSDLGQTLTLVKGDWIFSIQNGHYNNTQYNTIQYFTN